MRVLLVNCAPRIEVFQGEALELGYLAAFLNARGHQATYIKQIHGGRYFST